MNSLTIIAMTKNYKEEHQRYIFSITEDRQGLLWLGTGNGIKSFDEKTGEFQTLLLQSHRFQWSSVIIRQ